MRKSWMCEVSSSETTLWLESNWWGGKWIHEVKYTWHLGSCSQPKTFAISWSRDLTTKTIQNQLLAVRPLHPRKLTCPLKMHYFNRKYIFQPFIFRGHVSFPGSTWNFKNNHQVVLQLQLNGQIVSYRAFESQPPSGSFPRRSFVLTSNSRIDFLEKKKQVLPGKLTCPLKINGWKMYFLLK